jgi:threonine-phosphate decarboxylase
MEIIKSQNIEQKTQSAVSDHGGNIYNAAQELGISENEIIDFSASINPLGISDKVKKVIAKEIANLVNYPDPDAKMLRQFISAHLSIKSDSIICGNGSTELIYLLPRALKPEKVLITAPTFSEYERACKIGNELRVMSYELREENGFAIQPDGFVSAMNGCDMAFLCNPNNPTGHMLGKDVVLTIARTAEEMKCYLVVDEAFIEFASDDSVVREVQNNPYLIVLRSLTKFYAMAGLRVGYGVFNEAVIESIKEFKEPWTVNNLAQHSAVAAIGDTQYIKATMDLMRHEKKYLENGFKDIGITFFASEANFYLIKLNPARDVCNKLKEKGILVRDCSNFKGLDRSYIRVAVKSDRENKRLIQELSGLCGK